MKLLLYCTKGKPNLWKPYEYEVFPYDEASWFYLGEQIINLDIKVNGKIVAQCDCEKIETICPEFGYLDAACEGGAGYILDKACLTRQQLIDYGKGKWLNALHLSNLEVFDNPKKLSDFGVKKAPQNMMKCFDDKGNEYILISIRPDHLKNILNGKKTIEVRKKILKCLEELMK